MFRSDAHDIGYRKARMLPMVVFINEYMPERLILIPILFERGWKPPSEKPCQRRWKKNPTLIIRKCQKKLAIPIIGTMLADNSDAGIGLQVWRRDKFP